MMKLRLASIWQGKVDMAYLKARCSQTKNMLLTSVASRLCTFSFFALYV